MADTDKRDVVMENIGCGFYQVAMFLVCSSCVMAEAVAIGSFNFGVPVAVCDMQLNAGFIPWSEGLLSFGAAVGGVLLGALSDAVSRSLVLPMGLLVASSGLLVAAFVTSGSGLLLAAMLLGFGLGAVGPAARVYMAEIVTAGGRGCVLVLLDACWAAAYFACLMVWWSESPVGGARPQKLEVGVTRLWSWRTGVAVACFCCLVAACLTAVLHNTPRQLLCKGRAGEAHFALRHIFAMNYNQPETNYQAGAGLVEAVRLRPLRPGQQQQEAPALWYRCWRWRWRVPLRLQLLLSDRATRRATVAAAIANAALSPGWELMLVWSARLVGGVGGPAWWLRLGCAVDLSAADAGLLALLVRGCATAALLLLPVAATIDCVGRRPAAVVGLALGSGMSVALVAVQLSGRPRWLQLLLQALSAAIASQVAQAAAALHVGAVEMYPTHSRATMAGLVVLPRRVITALLHMVPAIPSTALCYAHGVAMLLGAVAACFLIELKRQPLVE